MARTRLVDAWHRSRRERTRMPWGRRVASMEHQLGADMTPGRHARWERLDHDHDHETEHETEHEEESVAGSDEHSEEEQAPHPGVQAQEFEAQLFSETFGGAGLADEQVGDAATEIDDQQHDQQHEQQHERHRQAQEPDLERDGFAEYEAAQEREEAAEQERVAALAAGMSLERARSIVSDPTWHDERYDGVGDLGELDAAQAVCEQHGVNHQAMSRVLEDYRDFDLGDPYSDEVQADVHAAGQPREREPEFEDEECEP